MKKLLYVFLAFILVFSVFSVNVLAADVAVIAEKKGSEGGLKNEGSKAVKDEEAGTASVIDDTYTDHVFGYNANVEAGKIVKTAFYLTIDEVTDTSQSLRINPLIKGTDQSAERWADVSYSLLADYEGENVIVVGAYTIPEGCNEIEARLWVNAGLKITIHKVVIAPNEYNFLTDPDFELIFEGVDAANDSNAAENIILSEDIPDTPSDDNTGDDNTGDDNTGDDNTGDDNTGDNNNNDDGKEPNGATGDVGVIAAILTSGAAVFGGLKLRKK